MADIGASGIYLTPWAHCTNINPGTAAIPVDGVGGSPHCSSETCDVPVPQLPHIGGHTVLSFHHSLMGVGPLCDHNCCVLF